MHGIVAYKKSTEMHVTAGVALWRELRCGVPELPGRRARHHLVAADKRLPGRAHQQRDHHSVDAGIAVPAALQPARRQLQEELPSRREDIHGAARSIQRHQQQLDFDDQQRDWCFPGSDHTILKGRMPRLAFQMKF